MIYDTFPFFNELELLELRLRELDGVVDRFVLVEATRTHANRPKPLHFAENKARFAAFADRIIHVVVDDTPDTADAWAIERFQRDAILRGLGGCRPDDRILMSDVDEIPRAGAVAAASQTLRYRTDPITRTFHAALRARPATRALRGLFRRYHPFVKVFEQIPCAYYLNCVCLDRRCLGTRMVLHRDLGLPRDLRHWRGAVVRDGGWHFTCMGGVERVREKLAAFAHQEYNTPEHTNPERLRQQIERGENLFSASAGPGAFTVVPLDHTFPAALRDHPERFGRLIKPVSGPAGSAPPRARAGAATRDRRARPPV